MTADQFRACLNYLVPGAIFSVHGDHWDYVVWDDPRPQPREIDCLGIWPVVEAARVVDKQALRTAATNGQTIGSALDNALTANAAALTTLSTWRTTGPGAGTANLSAAQEAQALRQMADNQIATIKQLNGLIRLIRRKLDTAEAAAGPRV